VLKNTAQNLEARECVAVELLPLLIDDDYFHDLDHPIPPDKLTYDNFETRDDPEFTFSGLLAGDDLL
jgi:hypothetical protein